MVVRWCVSEAGAVLAAVGESRALELAGPAAAARSVAFRRREDGDAHVAARVLVRMLLADTVAGTAPAEWIIDQRCDDAGCRRSEEHGRPFALRGGSAGPAVSWSHSSGLVACAVADGTERIGVDVERAGGGVPPLVSSWQSWVRAEALVKAGLCDLDRALTLPLGRAEFLDENGDTVAVRDLDPPSGPAGAPPLVGALAMRAAVSSDAFERIPLSALCSPRA